MSLLVTVLTAEPTIAILAEMRLAPGVGDIYNWVREHRPDCLPKDGGGTTGLWPHDWTDKTLSGEKRVLTENELLVELAGRKCYDSFGERAGRKSNREYIENTQSGDIPHASILYHAKFSFFFAGISRRVSHELIRNYVGADREEEGAPSQESTRFAHHYGFFICPPRYLGNPVKEAFFKTSMQVAYDAYLEAVDSDVRQHERDNGSPPTGMDRKRIYEAASSFLPHQAETSFIWTTNPAAIAKLVRERDNPAADLEIQRFARKLKRVVVDHAPNLFPQPWMRP